MAIEIVDLPINSMAIFRSYVMLCKCLPEGKQQNVECSLAKSWSSRFARLPVRKTRFCEKNCRKSNLKSCELIS